MLDSTKQNVVNSLLTLLDEKPMDDITISELTDGWNLKNDLL